MCTNVDRFSFRLWRRKQEYAEKTTDLSQVTEKFNHIMLYRVLLAYAGFELTTLVVISTDCTGRCKSSYPMVMTTTAATTIDISVFINGLKAPYT